MTKTWVWSQYVITLERILPAYPDDDGAWTWKLGLGAEVIASGETTYRWSAVRRAKKAARRHLRGKPPVPARVAKSNVIIYPIDGWKKV